MLASPYLDTWRHGYVEVTQNMLCVLVLGALPQKRQKAGGILVTISDLTERRDRWREEEKETERTKVEKTEKGEM